MASIITALAILGATVLPDGADAAVPNGWAASVTFPDDGTSTFDPTKIVLTVTDPGYDATGTTTVTRTIRGTAVIRKQYPNQAQRLNSAASGTRTVYIALDDEIYAGSTVTAGNADAGYYGAAAAGSIAGISNGSSLAYPKATFAWLNVQHDRATGSAFAVEAVAYHRHGRNGQMVPRVEFSAKDSQGTPNVSATQTVTAPALSSIQTQGQIVEAWKASIPLSALTQGDLCFVSAKVYPWIGDSTAILDILVDGLNLTGDVATANCQTLLRFVNDKTGAYGGAFAYVKSGASGGTVSTVAATARAAPFATISAALAAVRTFNNANKSHNDHSGSSIRLMDNGSGGNVVHASGDHDSVVAGKCWTVIEQDPSNTGVASVSLANNYPASLLMWKVNIAQAGFFDGTNTAGWRMAHVGNTIAYVSGIAGINYRLNLTYFQNVTITGDISGAHPFKPYNGPARGAVPLALGLIALGSSADFEIYPYAMIGCQFYGGRFRDADLSVSTAFDSQDGMVIANNLFMKTRQTCNTGNQAIVRGLALVQNIIERAIAPNSQPALQIMGDNAAQPSRNVVMAYNTSPGVDASGRVNNFYTDAAAAVGVQQNGYMRFNLWAEQNTKSDTFTAKTTATGRTGNWRPRYQVGYRGNVDIRGGTDSSTAPDQSGASWLGEVLAQDGAHARTTISFVDDKTGPSGAGAGNYRLTGSSNPAYARVATGLAMLKYDAAGIARRNNGSGAAGAYERTDVVEPTVYGPITISVVDQLGATASLPPFNLSVAG